MKQKISANIILLGLVSFLNDLSSEMILPILPMFLTTLGGTSLIVGLVGGIRDSVSSLIKVVSGYWSDKTGHRKHYIYFGYSSSALFKFLLALSQTWYHVVIFTGLERVGKGIRTAPRDAIIADSMPDQKGKGFGIHQTLDTLGAIGGCILVLVLFWTLAVSFQNLILIAAMIALASLIPLYFVKERPRPEKTGTKNGSQGLDPPKTEVITFRTGLKKLPRPLIHFILVSGIFALANFSYMFFILRVQSCFQGKMSVIIPILLLILYNFIFAASAIPFGILADRIGKKKVIGLGYAAFGVTAIGFAIFKTLPAFIVLYIFYGLVYGILDGTQKAYVSDLAPSELRGTSLGLFHTVTGIMALPSSLITGLLWQSYHRQRHLCSGEPRANDGSYANNAG